MGEGKNKLRQKLLGQQLDKTVAILKKRYQPEKVIAFGSFVSEKTKGWSDLDVVIIKKTNKRFMDRLKEVALLVSPEVGMDILVYTPDEFREMSQNNIFVQEEIIKKGNVSLIK